MRGSLCHKVTSIPAAPLKLVTALPALHHSTCEKSNENEFEMVVMQLEEVMMDQGFNERVGAFMRTHCHEFDEGEENKLV